MGVIKGWKRYGFEGRAGKARWTHDATFAEIELSREKDVWYAWFRRKNTFKLIAADAQRGKALSAVAKWMKKNPKG